jgi:hypothetical protein
MLVTHIYDAKNTKSGIDQFQANGQDDTKLYKNVHPAAHIDTFSAADSILIKTS